MIILLSPAKTMSSSLTRSTKTTLPHFSEDTTVLLKLLQRMSLSNLKNMFGVSEVIARLNHERYQDFENYGTKQAFFSFDGPAYKHLGVSTLTDADLDFAQDHLRILCGLYGVLRPLDEMRPYRLEMSNKLANDRGPDLYTFWGSTLTESLNQELRERPPTQRFVVNCASQEYFKSIKPELLDGPVYTMEFPGPSVYAKQARGAFSRFAITQRVESPESLKDFRGNDGEYTFDEKKSTEKKFVFIRSAVKAIPKKEEIVKSESTQVRKRRRAP